MAQDNIPKNQIKSRNTIEQREHSDTAAARRVIPVDPSGEEVDLRVQLTIMNNLLAMQAGGISAANFIVNNDGFFVFNNDGNLIKVG